MDCFDYVSWKRRLHTFRINTEEGERIVRQIKSINGVDARSSYIKRALLTRRNKLNATEKHVLEAFPPEGIMVDETVSIPLLHGSPLVYFPMKEQAAVIRLLALGHLIICTGYSIDQQDYRMVIVKPNKLQNLG